MRRGLLTVAVLTLLGASAVPTLTATGAASAATSRHGAPTYYVSLGDSYAVGYQPGIGATPGYAAYVAKRTHLTLANFGCGGATTTSILNTVGCPDVLPHTAGAMAYPAQTQVAAAQSFLAAHKGHIGLVTVSIGGNDVTGCATDANPLTCLARATTDIKTDVTTLAGDLRAAAGPNVPILGLTYPDVILGSYVFPSNPPSAATMSLVSVSVTAFDTLINPALAAAYASAHGSLVDVTRATGAYTPLTQTVHTAKFGTIPVSVALVCKLTWFCARGDIHAKSAGYTLIGKLVVARRRRSALVGLHLEIGAGVDHELLTGHVARLVRSEVEHRV